MCVSKNGEMMARVPLLSESNLPDQENLIAKIRGRRGGDLINVYRTLLHSPPLAETWFNHINQVRWGTEISGRLREIVIIRIAHVLSSSYILRQHVPKLAEIEGLTNSECSSLADWKAAGVFNEADEAALAYVDAMTIDVVVKNEIFGPMRAHYNDRQIVELTLMIGAYVSHARVLGALEVDLENI